MSSSYYETKSSYFALVSERARQDENMRTFFTACNIVMEGANDLSPLNEGVGDNLKNGWNKLVQFIKELVAKFIESLTNLFSSSKSWLEKYKKIILEKKPSDDATIDDFPSYDIGYQRITGATVPQFNPDADADKLKDNESFIRYICPAIGSVFGDVFPEGTDSNSKISSGLKKYFQGGDPREGVKMTDLNFTDLYNYCYNYTKLTDLVKKDQKAIESSTNTANNAITQAISKLSDEEKNQTGDTPKENAAEKKDNDDNKTTDTNDTKTEDNKKEEEFKKKEEELKRFINGERSKYSREPNKDVKQRIKDGVESKKTALINDAKSNGVTLDLSGPEFKLEFAVLYGSNELLYNIITEAPKINTGKSEAPKPSTSSNAATRDRNTTYNKGNTATTQDNTDKAAANASNNNKGDEQAALQEVSEKLSVYQNVTNSLFSTKLEVITEIYNAYMSILRAHVRSIVGKEADTASVAPSVATDNKSSVYSEVRKNDIERARDAYNNASGDEEKKKALATYTTTIKRIYGNSAYDNAFRDTNKGKSDEVTTNNYFADQFMTNYNSLNK